MSSELERLRRRVAELEQKLARRDEQEAFLRGAFNDAPIGMALVGLDEVIFEANDALCRMLGYSRDALLKLTVTDITHPDDLTIEAKPKGQMADGTSRGFVVRKRYVRADGSVLVGMLSVSALYDENDKPAYFIGQLEDITRAHEAEQSLSEREALLSALVDGVDEHFCVLDQDHCIRFASPTLAASSNVGESIWGVVVAEDRDELVAALHTARERERATCVVRLREAATPRHYEVLIRSNARHDVLPGPVLSFRDITERMSLEQELERARRLESLGQLAGGVAHDFNNLLGVILITVELMGEHDLPEQVRADLTAVREAAGRARDLTSQLMAVGRQSHGRRETIGVQGRLTSLRGLLQRLLGEATEFEVALSPTELCVNMGAARFEQVVINLVSNAADAMRDGGRLTLSTRVGMVVEGEERVLSPGEYVVIEVRDTGVGIEAEHLDSIFDPFFTTKGLGQGTGLGLATVYGIVAQAGGHVAVESTLGRGSVFSVWLPRVDDLRDPVEVSAEAEPTSQYRILVVEDDRPLLRATRRLLVGAGHDVETCAHPERALSTWDDSFDLLITDVVMPKMSGWELHRELEKHHGRVPVVFASGYATTMQSELGQHPGFVQKPFARQELLNAVEEAVRRAPRTS